MKRIASLLLAIVLSVATNCAYAIQPLKYREYIDVFLVPANEYDYTKMLDNLETFKEQHPALMPQAYYDQIYQMGTEGLELIGRCDVESDPFSDSLYVW